MNDERRRNTPEEILEVVSGFTAGNIIQARPIEVMSQGWVKCEDPIWNFSLSQYRIKPAEPKRVKLCCIVHKDGLVSWVEDGSNRISQERDVGLWTRRPEFDMEAECAA